MSQWRDKLRRQWGRTWKPRVLREARSVGMVSLCFDDFAKTAWTEGGPILRDHGARATYYVSGGLCGTVFAGNRMYDIEDLEAVHAEGHEVGCHTFEHVSCLRRSNAEFERSLEKNERFVRERLGDDVRLVSFAYPYGDAPWISKSIAVNRFRSARGVDAGLNRSRLDLGQLKAVGLEASKRSLATVERYLAEAAATGGWLIAFTHEVKEDPGDFGCTPTELDRFLRSAKAAGLQILTVKEALGARAG